MYLSWSVVNQSSVGHTGNEKQYMDSCVHMYICTARQTQIRQPSALSMQEEKKKPKSKPRIESQTKAVFLTRARVTPVTEERSAVEAIIINNK